MEWPQVVAIVLLGFELFVALVRGVTNTHSKRSGADLFADAVIWGAILYLGGFWEG